MARQLERRKLNFIDVSELEEPFQNILNKGDRLIDTDDVRRFRELNRFELLKKKIETVPIPKVPVFREMDAGTRTMLIESIKSSVDQILFIKKSINRPINIRGLAEDIYDMEKEASRIVSGESMAENLRYYPNLFLCHNQKCYVNRKDDDNKNIHNIRFLIFLVQ